MLDIEREQMLEEIEDTQKDKFLTFSIGDEFYGIEIRFVTEIIGMQPITEVPEVPHYVKGIINLRGKIIPVIDVRLKFGRKEKAYTDRTCIIVVDITEVSVGFIVDYVAEVVTIPDEQIAAPPDSRTGFHNRYIQGIGKIDNDVKLLLDCEKILTESEMEAIESIEEEAS